MNQFEFRMLSQPHRKDDVEAGGREMTELRWAFIQKIYVILSIQLLLTIAVAAVVVTVHPILHFFATTVAGLALYIVLTITPLIVLWPLYYYHQRHPVNYFLLAVFTVSLAFRVGLACSYTNGKVILESVILSGAVMVSLTLYTFWAARRGLDFNFNFLGTFPFGALLVLVLMLFASIQIFFPLGRISEMIYGGVASIIFCGYIVYDTDNLIKRYRCDQFIRAVVALYLDMSSISFSVGDLHYP